MGEPKEESEEEEEELPPLAKYQIHFFGVVRRMAVESYLWSMQEQHELRWLESPPDGLWTTGGEWAVAAFEDREAWREMGSRLGGGIRGLFSARIYVEQVADTDGDGDEDAEPVDEGPGRRHSKAFGKQSNRLDFALKEDFVFDRLF